MNLRKKVLISEFVLKLSFLFESSENTAWKGALATFALR